MKADWGEIRQTIWEVATTIVVVILLTASIFRFAIVMYEWILGT